MTTAVGAGFTGRYWLVVAAEVLGLLAGLLVITRVLHAPRATLPWIAFVVGVHFFGLAVARHRHRGGLRHPPRSPALRLGVALRPLRSRPGGGAASARGIAAALPS
ncbi:hypothetical protein ABT084_00780 [Streptomyces sp. NPDC002138]|uniref:hypothetical protein n=1 Tax=Streptomyces sp. NPDC002138 TaxID=3154410 RepID=UPI00332F40F4